MGCNVCRLRRSPDKLDCLEARRTAWRRLEVCSAAIKASKVLYFAPLGTSALLVCMRNESSSTQYQQQFEFVLLLRCQPDEIFHLAHILLVAPVMLPLAVALDSWVCSNNWAHEHSASLSRAPQFCQPATAVLLSRTNLAGPACTSCCDHYSDSSLS